MFEKLKSRWNVSGRQLIIILIVFAITGATTAYISKVITGWVGITDSSPLIWRILLRTAVLLFGYQVIILIVAFIFGQFSFFWNYEKKILKRMGMLRSPATSDVQLSLNGISLNTGTTKYKTRIAIFASGTGSNAQKIIDKFRDSDTVKVALIVCNKSGAGVLNIAEKENIPYLIIEKEKFFRGTAYVEELFHAQIDFIVLAGFLWKLPIALIQSYPRKIINIHPALLPNYGGKGMYGHFVHEAVIANKEKESGISIHYVDELYDHGETIFQAKCPVDETDTPDSLAEKIHKLEHQYYPDVISELIEKQNHR